jgi:hypothetical protein
MEIRDVRDAKNILFNRLANEQIFDELRDTKLEEYYITIIDYISDRATFGHHIIDLAKLLEDLPIKYVKKLKQMLQLKGFVFISENEIDLMR